MIDPKPAPPAPAPYRGRFAPSPTGPLHRGSAVAALGSYLDARSRGGAWLLRIDDADRDRSRPGAGDAIRRELERLGLRWDGEPWRQVGREPRYQAALGRLDAEGLTFACGCTRREVGPGPYPGTCRGGLRPGRAARSIRLAVDGRIVALDDAIQGRYQQDLASAVGDFIVRRADGVLAYHLGTVVDDADAGVSTVVRGADLLASTPRQIRLQQCLGLPTPGYAHLPVVVDARGDKLSKQTGATATDTETPEAVLRAALTVLGHSPPAEIGNAPEMLAWAAQAWRIERVPRGPVRWPTS